MANGRTYRPGPRVEYAQKVLRFDDDTLSTAEIVSPLDVAYAPGGTRWRQINSGSHRPGSEAYYQRHPFNVLDTTVTGTVAVTQVDDVAAIAGTFTDPAYGDGGIRDRQQSGTRRRLTSWVPFLRRVLPVPVETYTGTIAATQDDDSTAITGQGDLPYTGDNPAHARAQSSVYRRLASRIPYLRRLLPVPVETYTGTIAVTQDDDAASIVGQADLPYIGDSPIHVRSQSTVYRRIASRIPFTRHFLTLPQDTTVVASVTVTQDDDTVSITGTFTDPAYGDGGIRVRAQSSVYRRLASRLPFNRRVLPVPPETYTATIAVTQNDDAASITGQADLPYTGADPARARAQSSVYRYLASRLPFIRRIIAPPVTATVAGSIAATQDDDVAAITGTFTGPTNTGDGGIRARVQCAAYRRASSSAYYAQRRTFAAPLQPVTGTVAVTQDDDTANIVGQSDVPYTGDGGIRLRIHLARRPVQVAYCQRQRRAAIDVSVVPVFVPPSTTQRRSYTFDNRRTYTFDNRDAYRFDNRRTYRED